MPRSSRGKNTKPSVEVVVQSAQPRPKNQQVRRKPKRAPRDLQIGRKLLAKSMARENNQQTVTGSLSDDLVPTDTPEGSVVLRIVVDPFLTAADHNSVFGWPDGTNQPTVSPHYFGEMSDVSNASGTYSGEDVYPVLQTAILWNYIQLYDADVGVLNEMFYSGDLATTTFRTFRTQRSEYGLKVLNEPSNYTKSRVWSSGFTTEFTATLTTDSGKSTVVQVPGNAKCIGPDPIVEGSSTMVYRYYMNLLGLEDVTAGDPTRAAQVFTQDLPNADSKRFRARADEGHCCPIKLTRCDLPFENFNHSLAVNTTSKAYYYNPLYVAFYGTAEAPASGNGQTFVEIPFDIPEERRHTIMISHYQGLSPQSAFRIKTYEYAECAVALNSILQPYTKDGLMIDRRCMDLASSIHSRMPSAYPSSYNFWGGLWKGIKKGLGFLGKVAKPLSGLIPGGRELYDVVEGVGKNIGIFGGPEISTNKLLLDSPRTSDARTSNVFKSLNSKLSNMTLALICFIGLFCAAFGQVPLQVIVCNNPNTPGICGANLPVFSYDPEQIGLLSEIDQKLNPVSTDVLAEILGTLGRIEIQNMQIIGTVEEIQDNFVLANNRLLDINLELRGVNATLTAIGSTSHRDAQTIHQTLIDTLANQMIDSTTFVDSLATLRNIASSLNSKLNVNIQSQTVNSAVGIVETIPVVYLSGISTQAFVQFQTKDGMTHNVNGFLPMDTLALISEISGTTDKAGVLRLSLTGPYSEIELEPIWTA